MHNVSDIFALWPSDADLGRDIGVAYPTVSAWKQRGSIPPAYWRAIIGAAGRRGHHVSADMILDVHTPASKESPGGSFGEREAAPFISEPQTRQQEKAEEATDSVVGHFSRHRQLRRARFRTAEEIEDHIRALRDEWTHR